jgi:hypothetical protein
MYLIERGFNNDEKERIRTSIESKSINKWQYENNWANENINYLDFFWKITKSKLITKMLNWDK